MSDEEEAKEEAEEERDWNKQLNPMVGYLEGNLMGIQGAGNEQLVAARALKHGFIAFFKLWSDAKYDMVVDCGGQLFRAQIKGTSGGSVPFTTRQRGGEAKEHRKPLHHYDRSDCDLIIGVDSDTGDCYILPIDYVVARGDSSASFKKLKNFKERWDFIAGNEYLTVQECRDGLSFGEMRNKLSKMGVTPPSGKDELSVTFYETCPAPSMPLRNRATS